MVEQIHSNQAPEAIGPYSQAIKAGDFVYVSGQIPLDEQTGELVEGIEQQTHKVMTHLKSILSEAGADFSNVVKFTIYLDSMEHFSTVNDIYGSYLNKPYPARAAYEVSRLPKNALIEMDVVAYKG